MKMILSVLLIAASSLVLATTSEAAGKLAPLKCVSSDAAQPQVVLLSKNRAQAKVLASGAKDASPLAALDCAKVEGTPVDENGLVRLLECREPNKVDAGYVAIVHRNSSGQIQVDLSGQSFAGPHLIGTLLCR